MSARLRRVLGVVGVGAIAALGLVALSCARWVRLDEVPKPYFSTEHVAGMCGSHDYVDGSGQAWHEHGCEDGEGNRVKAIRTVSADDHRALAAAFAALPTPTPRPPCHDSATLERVEGDGRRTTWQVCLLPPDRTLPPPFGEADALLRRLTEP